MNGDMRLVGGVQVRQARVGAASCDADRYEGFDKDDDGHVKRETTGHRSNRTPDTRTPVPDTGQVTLVVYPSLYPTSSSL